MATSSNPNAGTLKFGPLERVLAINFPKPLKVYWVWQFGGPTRNNVFPGKFKWPDVIGRDRFGDNIFKDTPAPWKSIENIWGKTRNAVGKGSMSTFCGIDANGKRKRPTAFTFNLPLAKGTINEMATEVVGGFFIDKAEAIKFAGNVFNKGLTFVDFAANHSWPYQFLYLVEPIPAIFDTTLPNGGSLGHTNVVCDLSPYGYTLRPKQVFNTIQIWETTWPDKGGTGPLNDALPKLKLTIAKVSATDKFGPNADISGNPGTFKYALFEGGGVDVNGFANYKQVQDPSQGFIGTQLTDTLNSFAEAQAAKAEIEKRVNEQRRIFFPHDGFPAAFDLEPKLVASIAYSGGGQSEGVIKPPLLPHVCTHPAFTVMTPGEVAYVIDSCGNKIITINTILGQQNPGFEGPIGFDRRGFL